MQVYLYYKAIIFSVATIQDFPSIAVLPSIGIHNNIESYAVY